MTLSPRELDVAELVSKAYSSKEIAEKLIVSQFTVKTHLHNIYGKLGFSGDGCRGTLKPMIMLVRWYIENHEHA